MGNFIKPKPITNPMVTPSYQIKIISQEKKDELLKGLKFKFERKADIHGMSIEFLTNNKEFKEMWEDNFNPMNESIRPHARILMLSDNKTEPNTVLYDPIAKTVFIYNSDYYGYVKSVALALATDFLEDYHSIHQRGAIHGACIDFQGRGVAIIAPPKTGKTTMAYGLLTAKDSKLVADDWIYVKITDIDVIAYMSERNSYIADDLGKNWPVFQPLVTSTSFDLKKRGVANVADIIGYDRMKSETVLRKIVLLKRDFNDKILLRKITKEEALSFLIKNNFCNPHILMRDKRKDRLRREFFSKLLEKVEAYMLNTTETPKQSLEKLKSIVQCIN